MTSGSQLGPYQIVAKLGEGGMGEVWRGTDTRLRRDVAIKVLPAAFTADRERLARFEREAQLLAQLHHPNVAAIFGLEEADGVRALVMELAEGEDLAVRIARGPIPPLEAVAIARQIAEALEAAHERGIVHRDLKPTNVKLREDGAVKVLDFGLAKAMDTSGGVSGSSPATSPTLMNSPTLTAVHATQLGMILGTAAYMAPEQAAGKAVDRRADIWAFGVVLHEMLTGRRLFDGDSVAETLAGVLKTEVDFGALPTDTPPALRRLLRRCLERNPKNRLHDIADARLVLDDVLAGRADAPATAGPAAAALPARPRWPLATAMLLAGLLAGGALIALWQRHAAIAVPSPRPTRFEVPPPAGSTFERGLAISPDGRRIAFAARDAEGQVTLWVRSLDSLAARQLPETEDARLPFWAPDSRRIGFFSKRSLKWIDPEGGAPQVIAPTSAVQDVRGAAWGGDDTILFAPTYASTLLAVAAKGGAVRPAVQLPADGSIGTARFPAFLPDGRRFVFYGSPGTGTEPGTLYLGRLGSLAFKRLGPASSSAVFAEPGYLVFASGEAIFAQRFDDQSEELVGELVATGIEMGGSLAVSGLRSVANSRNGILVSRSDRRNASQLVWVDRAGKELGTLNDAQSSWSYAPRLSPDGRLVVAARYTLPNGNLGQIWVYDTARQLASRLSFNDGDDTVALWLGPGSREVLYNSTRAGAGTGMYRLALDRPGEQLWVPGPMQQTPVAVTPDGRRVIFERDEGIGNYRLWIRDRDGSGAATRLGSPTANETSADVSPDGRWIAYSSDLTGRWEVYVRPLGGEGSVVRISTEGGNHPLWKRDGLELFYVDSGGRLVAVPIATPGAGDPAGGAMQPGLAQVLFAGRLEEASDRQYDVTADGQRFLLNRSVGNNDVPIVVAIDWTAMLTRSAP